MCCFSFVDDMGVIACSEIQIKKRKAFIIGMKGQVMCLSLRFVVNLNIFNIQADHCAAVEDDFVIFFRYKWIILLTYIA